MNLTELELQIVHYNAQYREGQPEISDEQYDKLIDQLKKEQPNSSLLKRGVIEQPKESRKVKLPVPMMSLEKEKTFSGLIKWLDQYGNPKVVITPKFDGISILKTPDKCLTRGDGIVGQDCSLHCSFLPSSPEIIKGEMVILKDRWETFDVFRKYKHPRNTVAGWINGDYDPQTPYYAMQFIAYEVINSTQNKSEQLKYLRDGSDFTSSPFLSQYKSDLLEKVLDELFYSWSKYYPLDGLVIELDDYSLRVGEHSNGNPKYAMAYKPPHYTEVAETVIKSIEFAVNRYGTVTPTIVFEAINISGADLSRVNGINMSYLYDWCLFPGEKVKIIRSGEVIPKIIEVGGVKIPFVEEFNSNKEYESSYKSNQQLREVLFNKGIRFNYMDEWCTCPYCGATLSWDENMVNQFCPNESCPERKFQGIYDFFRILEVEEFSEKTFRLLYENSFTLLNSILNISIEDLMKIPGFAERSAQLFTQAMSKLKTQGVPLSRYMHASGCFPNLGEKTLQLILDSTDSEDIPKREYLVTIKGVGAITADIFLEGLKNFVYGFEETDVKISYRNSPQKEKRIGVFSGSVFCFTGCRPSPELRQKLEDAGAEISENFNSKVTHLITRDKNSTSSKIEKAKRQGVLIISLEEISSKF